MGCVYMYGRDYASYQAKMKAMWKVKDSVKDNGRHGAGVAVLETNLQK